ncbi:hypothetical protein EKO27_g8739 [Xylaria grammica]|uniref:Uncharacterized protein n=1 Tax=Xylaria grammica TaxID=363999 RepID=A0A439CWF8_9PEZI|nr:hypothetical protein EKO27_g8739 [Xylaria grammica]
MARQASGLDDGMQKHKYALLRLAKRAELRGVIEEATVSKATKRTPAKTVVGSKRGNPFITKTTLKSPRVQDADTRIHDAHGGGDNSDEYEPGDQSESDSQESVRQPPRRSARIRGLPAANVELPVKTSRPGRPRTDRNVAVSSPKPDLTLDIPNDPPDTTRLLALDSLNLIDNAVHPQTMSISPTLDKTEQTANGNASNLVPANEAHVTSQTTAPSLPPFSSFHEFSSLPPPRAPSRPQLPGPAFPITKFVSGGQAIPAGDTLSHPETRHPLPNQAVQLPSFTELVTSTNNCQDEAPIV